MGMERAGLVSGPGSGVWWAPSPSRFLRAEGVAGVLCPFCEGDARLMIGVPGRGQPTAAVVRLLRNDD
jgi:hypothetical protein